MKKGLGKHLKETMILAVPLVIGQLGQMMMGVVDSVMVGHLGAAPLAAASLGSGLFLIILLFGTGRFHRWFLKHLEKVTLRSAVRCSGRLFY